MTSLLASFGNVFGPDVLVIFFIVLLLFGAKKLPELARGLGQSLNEFRRAREDFEHEIQQGQAEVKPREAADRQARTTVTTSPSAAELQQQVDELQQQLRAVQQRQQTPQLANASPSSSGVTHEASGTGQPS
jgi:sec-independent protein translocase protein TatA